MQNRSISSLRSEKKNIVKKNDELGDRYTKTLVSMHQQIEGGLEDQYQKTISQNLVRIAKLE